MSRSVRPRPRAPDRSERGRRDRSEPRRFGEGLTDDDGSPPAAPRSVERPLARRRPRIPSATSLASAWPEVPPPSSWAEERPGSHVPEPEPKPADHEEAAQPDRPRRSSRSTPTCRRAAPSGPGSSPRRSARPSSTPRTRVARDTSASRLPRSSSRRSIRLPAMRGGTAVAAVPGGPVPEPESPLRARARHRRWPEPPLEPGVGRPSRASPGGAGAGPQSAHAAASARSSPNGPASRLPNAPARGPTRPSQSPRQKLERIRTAEPERPRERLREPEPERGRGLRAGAAPRAGGSPPRPRGRAGLRPAPRAFAQARPPGPVPIFPPPAGRISLPSSSPRPSSETEGAAEDTAAPVGKLDGPRRRRRRRGRRRDGDRPGTEPSAVRPAEEFDDLEDQDLGCRAPVRARGRQTRGRGAEDDPLLDEFDFGDEARRRIRRRRSPPRNFVSDVVAAADEDDRPRARGGDPPRDRGDRRPRARDGPARAGRGPAPARRRARSRSRPRRPAPPRPRPDQAPDPGDLPPRRRGARPGHQGEHRHQGPDALDLHQHPRPLPRADARPEPGRRLAQDRRRGPAPQAPRDHERAEPAQGARLHRPHRRPGPDQARAGPRPRLPAPALEGHPPPDQEEPRPRGRSTRNRT